MSGVFFNVSGIDPNEGANVVFVWCRGKAAKDHALVGSGHVVSAAGSALPPGIASGQFSVTFLLPPGCSAEDIFVTDDKNGSERLPGVSITPCVGVSPNQLGKGVASDSPP